MALTFTACDEGTPPPVEPPPPPTPVGTISGTVTIEGTAASGITATLSSGATTTTGSGGSFAFSGVEAGTYTVTISGFPEDATFAQVTQSATIATDGQNVQLNFAGEYIRSSSVVGNVVAADAMMSGGDGQPETLVGVTVTLGGEHAMGETMETGEDGGFMFTGLRAGTYTVTISDFPEDVSFETVSVEVEVEVGEVGSADFTGHFIRTSAVEGQVVIEGEGLAGVTVTLSGGPADESYTMLTDADGMYRFEELRPGEYTVSISDFDTRDYEFAATSQDVSVDLDETGTVSFTGVLLRTSGISGRVSVEGMGLGDIAVTLAGGDESRTAMTDAGGQYSFAGLAAGDYTVSIAVESDAYVFDSMSADVTLGDDDAKIVNFDGAHARTASVSGMVFLDEAAKNDMYDEGEHPLAHAGIPVALVGPGVNEQRLGATDATGAFSFEGLQAGPYQLVVLINATVAAALAANDVAYGGPGEGYSVALGVGEAAAQNVPFDITHTTVNFTVSLKHGDETGDALPGATVMLEGADGATVGSGETGEDGSVTLKVRRDRTEGNMVMAGVSTDGYDVADGMTKVSWDPQMFATAAGNSNDIVNLNVDVSVSGATVTTDAGGGDALAGWAIGVMSGEDAVDGAPEMLDDDGNASFMTAVTPDDLPATFTISLADDQDDEMDGGESFGAEPVTHVHTGLKLAGTVDAGMLEAAFTTQTLMVYVHYERDHVHGYTGNVLESDVRASTDHFDLDIRYIDDAGRSRSFTKDEWDEVANSQFAADSETASGSLIHRGHGKTGLAVFSHLPADANVVVKASKANSDANIEILDPDELATYRNLDMNGVMGGAFGDMGGTSHTVSLCPLMAVDPTDQNHDECSSFAYVNTHQVTGQAWKRLVTADAAGDGFKYTDLRHVTGTTVSVDPVEGKNLGDDSGSFTAASTNSRATPLDDRKQFDFGQMAEGVYKVSVPTGWTTRQGAPGSLTSLSSEFRHTGDLQIDVVPATGVIYGRIIDSDSFAVAGATVDVNGEQATTDAKGRYIVEGFGPVTGFDGRPTQDIYRNKRIVVVAATMEDFKVAADTMLWNGSHWDIPDGDARWEDSNPAGVMEMTPANAPFMHDMQLGGVTATVDITGRVTDILTGDGIAAVEVKVDGVAPLNKATRGQYAGKLVTGADGTYTARIETKQRGQTASVSVAKNHYHFPVDASPVLADGNSPAVVNFQGYQNGTITGTVEGPSGRALAGVTVTATSTAEGATTAADEAMTNSVGQFTLSVPPVSTYRIEAMLGNHVFTYPNNNQTIFAGPGQTVSFGRIKAATAGALNLTAVRERVVDDAATEDVDESTQRWGTTILVNYDADVDNMPEGYAAPTYTIQTNTSTDPTAAGHPWVDATATAVQEDGADVPGSFTIPTPDAASGGDGEFKVRVVTTADETTPSTPPVTYSHTSAEVTVAAIDPSATGVSARRQAAADSDEAAATGDFIQASWTALTNANSDFRVVAQVNAASTGSTVWVVLIEAAANDRSAVSVEIGDDYAGPLNVATASGTGASIPVTAAELRAAISIAVESVQGTAGTGDDAPKWMRSTAVSLAERESS
ncbi:MAG: hypothetical protein F4X13_05905 [Gammaproteobacteria bacterium]|nr:hypothetical protein [Gammaproteobacteria bacterium]